MVNPHSKSKTIPFVFFPTQNPFLFFFFSANLMEFKYQAIDDPSPASSIESYSNTMPENSREVMRRELEKKRIREEIIEREMERKRELEMEVRREMEMERELERRMKVDRFSSFQRTVGLPREKPVSIPVRNGGVSEVSVRVRAAEELLGKFPMNHILAGAKRKATLIDEHVQLASMKYHKGWSCALCQVKTTDEKNLQKHYEGKKHKARERCLRTDENGVKSMELCTLRCDYCRIKCNSELTMFTHLNGKKHAARVKWGSYEAVPDITASVKDIQKSEKVEVKEGSDTKVGREKVERGSAVAAKTTELPICENTQVTRGTNY